MPEELNPTELLDIMQFSADEQAALFEGISFSELPDTFNLSPAILKLCLGLRREASNASLPPKLIEALKRAREYSETKVAEGDNSYNTHISKLNEPLKKPEFNQRVYLEDKKLTVGKILRGTSKSVEITDESDGIRNEKNIVTIHTHPSEITFSIKDVLITLIDEPNIPETSLSLVVTEQSAFLLFPTNETKKVNFRKITLELQDNYKEREAITTLEPEEQAVAQIALIKKICQKYSLGFYAQEEGSSFKKI